MSEQRLQQAQSKSSGPCCDFKSIDNFGRGFRMKIDNDKIIQTSYMGSMLSILTALITLMFLYTKTITIMEKKDVDIMETHIDGAFDYDYKFTAQEGLFIAAALTEYNSDMALTEDPKYGELVFEHYSWGNQDSFGVDHIILDNHFCTDEDLGIDRTANTVMFPIKKNAENEFRTYRNKYRCIDQKLLKIWGNYSSAKAQTIVVRFKMCKGEHCESEANIRQWLKQKYIVLVHNVIRFDSEKYFENSRVPEAHLVYLPISTQVREDIAFKVHRTELELQDYNEIMLDQVTLTNLVDLFSVNKFEVRSQEYSDDYWVSVSFEMDHDLTQIERSQYTVFDLLSDVGGILGILTSMALVIDAVWNYQAFDNFMVSRLFRIKKPKEEITGDMDHFSQSDYIKLSSKPNLRNWILSFVPKACFCCSYNRKDRALQLARTKLDTEINIIQIVKSWRYFESAIKLLLRDNQRLELKERSRYLSIDPDEQTEEKLLRSSTIRAMKKQEADKDYSDGFFSSSHEQIVNQQEEEDSQQNEDLSAEGGNVVEMTLRCENNENCQQEERKQRSRNSQANLKNNFNATIDSRNKNIKDEAEVIHQSSILNITSPPSFTIKPKSVSKRNKHETDPQMLQGSVVPLPNIIDQNQVPRELVYDDSDSLKANQIKPFIIISKLCKINSTFGHLILRQR